MVEMLASYAAGQWYTAADEGTLVLDASTSEPVARVSTTGLDTRAMVDHARRVGGPALRRLTFQQRAAALKELATYLDANKITYHELSLATGATRRDGTGDIDGGIGTTFVFSSRANTSCRTAISSPTATSSRSARAARSWDGTCTRRSAALCCRSMRSTSRCGHAREAGSGSARRRSEHREAGDADRVSHRCGDARHHRVGCIARRRRAVPVRRCGRPVRPPRR